MTATLFKWSIDDWHELVRSGVLDDKNVELLEGDIIQISPQDIKHSATNDFVGEYLRELLLGKAHIRRASPVTLDNSPHSSPFVPSERDNKDKRASEPEPDIAVLRLPRETYLEHHPYPENIYWLVEISNRTLKKDLGQKAIIYANNKIPEYWVIDLKNNKVIVHTQPTQNAYQTIEEYTSGTIQPVAFPDVKVELKHLLLY